MTLGELRTPFDGIDVGIIWSVVQRDLPAFKAALAAIAGETGTRATA